MKDVVALAGGVMQPLHVADVPAEAPRGGRPGALAVGRHRGPLAVRRRRGPPSLPRQLPQDLQPPHQHGQHREGL